MISRLTLWWKRQMCFNSTPKGNTKKEKRVVPLQISVGLRIGLMASFSLGQHAWENKPQVNKALRFFTFIYIWLLYLCWKMWSLHWWHHTDSTWWSPETKGGMKLAPHPSGCFPLLGFLFSAVCVYWTKQRKQQRVLHLTYCIGICETNCTTTPQGKEDSSFLCGTSCCSFVKPLKGAHLLGPISTVIGHAYFVIDHLCDLLHISKLTYVTMMTWTL